MAVGKEKHDASSWLVLERSHRERRRAPERRDTGGLQFRAQNSDERDVIARGVFTSVPDLKRKLMRYIRQYNKKPETVKWKYFDPSRRIAPESIVTVH